MKSLDKIILPDNIDEITKLAVEKAENEKQRKKKTRKSILAASIAGVMVFGVFLNTEGVRAAIEEVRGKIEGFYTGQVINENEDEIINQSLKEHKVVVNQTVEDSGVKVTLDEFYMDDEEIYVYLTATDKKTNGVLQGIAKNIFLNGKPIVGGNGSGVGFDYKEGSNETGALSTNSIERRDISDVKNVTIDIKSLEFREVSKKKNYKVEGNWRFTFDYDGSKAMKNIKYINLLNKGVYLGEDYVKLKEIKVTPFSMRIYTEQNTNKEIGKGTAYNLFLETENGKMINSSGGHGSGDALVYDFILDTKNINVKRIVPSQYKDGLLKKKHVFYKKDAIDIPTK